MRPLRLVALRALHQRCALYRQVGAALALPGMGVSGLWESHGRPIIRGSLGPGSTGWDAVLTYRGFPRQRPVVRGAYDGYRDYGV